MERSRQKVTISRRKRRARPSVPVLNVKPMSQPKQIISSNITTKKIYNNYIRTIELIFGSQGGREKEEVAKRERERCLERFALHICRPSKI